jgi:multidrug resistance efflux pump
MAAMSLFTPLSRWLRRPWVLALGVVVCLITTAALVLRAGRGPGDALVETVKRGDLVVTLTEAGVLRPAESITYRSPLTGRETEITYLTAEGTYVKQGDLLIRLDTTGLARELDQAIDVARQADVDVKAAESERDDAAAAVESATDGSGALDVEEANAKLRLAERNAARLRADYDGLRPLLDKGFITREELDRAAFDADQADVELSLMRKRVALLTSRTRPRDEQRARVQVEQRNVQVTNARQRAKDVHALVESLRAALGACNIYASHAGLVVHEEFLTANPRRRVRVGDRVSSTLGLVTIPEVERMWLDTSVREADLWRVKAGQTVAVNVDAFPAMRLTGHVVSIGTLGRSAAERPFDEKRFGVTVAIDGANRDLRPDMTARAAIAVAERRHVLMIPVSALVKQGDGWGAAVVRGWSTETRRVTVGENNGFDVEILEGLKEGERVSLSGGSAAGAAGGRR